MNDEQPTLKTPMPKGSGDMGKDGKMGAGKMGGPKMGSGKMGSGKMGEGCGSTGIY